MPYNIISCAGFEGAGELGGWVASTGCLKARLGIVVLFFVIALIRKWGGEELGFEYNFWISLGAGILLYFIMITIFGNLALAFILGLAGGLLGGYLGGSILGEEY